MLCISNTTLIKEASMFSVNTHQKKWKHYSFFNCTWTNNTVFYYSCYLCSNFSAFILSFYKRSKRKSRNKFTAIFWCELNSPSKHNQNSQQHMGLFSQSSSSTLGKINHMAGRNQLGVAINGVCPGLKLRRRKDHGICKTRNDVAIDILLPALLHQLSQESGVGVYIKKGKVGIGVQSDSCEQLK